MTFPGLYAVFCIRPKPSLFFFCFFFPSNQISTADQVPPFMCCDPSFGISAFICYHKELCGGLLLVMQGCNNEQCDKLYAARQQKMNSTAKPISSAGFKP